MDGEKSEVKPKLTRSGPLVSGFVDRCLAVTIRRRSWPAFPVLPAAFKPRWMASLTGELPVPIVLSPDVLMRSTKYIQR